MFDDNVLERVAQTSVNLQGELDVRHQALERCLQKLPVGEREFVMARYRSGGSVAEAAKRSGRSLVAAYKALGRIRKLLLNCVNRQLAMGAEA
jgi:RNA polymerase sigma-70 factor (ECF subfamily)